MRAEHLRDELGSIAHLGRVDLRSASQPTRADLTDVVHDSRRARDGSLFCAVPGSHVDGHDFAAAAAEHGATALLVERYVDVDCDQIKTVSVRRSMGHAAAIVQGHPSRQMAIAGITGTNGKTTTTQLLAAIMAAAGRECAVIGTLGGVHTTPESPDLQRQLRTLADAGTQVVALEVSSHALDQHRVDATEFAVAAFSNLTPDHLDYHLDMESYFDAKKRLFDGRAHVEIINVDDPWGARLASERPGAIRVSLDDVAIETETIDGSTFVWRGHRTVVPLPGQMNIANALMAAEMASALGVDESDVVAGLGAIELVPGRMQVVAGSSPGQPTVVVDYSHTPDSIDRALATLRAVTPNAELAIVFGCGGDRDRQKRPLMGQAAEAGADRVYVTNDNPRSEDPDAIIADALSGMTDPQSAVVEPDRKAAISRAIIESTSGDVVLIAGKGHERTQTIGSDVFPFDDVTVASEALEAANS